MTTQPDTMTAEEVRAARVQLQLSQVEFADTLSVSQQTISRWERKGINVDVKPNYVRKQNAQKIRLILALLE